jgi:hypothetical protein
VTRSVLTAIAALALSTCTAPAHAIDPGDLRAMQKVNNAVFKLGLWDCKAAAFETIRRLEYKGITARFMVVRTETGGFHAIAVVGDHAVDSRQSRIMTLNQLRAIGYWIAG